MNGEIAGPTTPFHTFDPLDSAAASQMIPAILSAAVGDASEFDSILSRDEDLRERLEEEGAEISNGRVGILWDDATLIFVTSMDRQQDGSPAPPLDTGVSKSRLGRFPDGNGNPLTYLRKYCSAPEDDSTITDLLTQIDEGLNLQGFGGLQLHGWLDASEVSTLREALQQQQWRVNRDEPCDGGVFEIVRHLVIILKSAERRKCGILMRAHA